MSLKRFFYKKDENTGAERISKVNVLIAFFVIVFFLFLGLMAIGLMSMTFLTLDSYSIDLNQNQTWCMVSGSTQPGSSVIISCHDLGFDNVIVPVGADGRFSYNITVPKTVNETSVSVTAEGDGKMENSFRVKIKRIFKKDDKQVKEDVLLYNKNVKLANGFINVDGKQVGTYSIVSSPPSVCEGVDQRTWKGKRVEIVDFAGSKEGVLDYYTEYQGQWVKLSIKEGMDRTPLEITDDIYTAMS